MESLIPRNYHYFSNVVRKIDNKRPEKTLEEEKEDTWCRWIWFLVGLAIIAIVIMIFYLVKIRAKETNSEESDEMIQEMEAKEK